MREKYQQVAWWYFRAKSKGNFPRNFKIDAPTSPSDFFTWLYNRNRRVNAMYNHLLLVAMLYKFFDNQAV